MVGIIDILDIFSYELIRAFEDMGYETMTFDVSKLAQSMKTMSEFAATPVKAVITFNSLGMNFEVIPGKNTWEALGIPCINILMEFMN